MGNASATRAGQRLSAGFFLANAAYLLHNHAMHRLYQLLRLRHFLPRVWRRKLRFLLLIAGLVGSLFGSWWLDGKVVSVADGDTLRVMSGTGTTQKIRLYGIDAPEYNQDYGTAATDFASSLAFLQEVSLEVLDTDQYGRQVAIVTLPDGRILNEELLKNGLAMVYRRYCRDHRCARWLELERMAKEEKKGLWAAKKPTPPWQWRARQRRR